MADSPQSHANPAFGKEKAGNLTIKQPLPPTHPRAGLALVFVSSFVRSASIAKNIKAVLKVLIHRKAGSKSESSRLEDFFPVH